MQGRPKPYGSVYVSLQLSLGAEPEDAARSRSIGEMCQKYEGFERCSGAGLTDAVSNSTALQVPAVARSRKRER